MPTVRWPREPERIAAVTARLAGRTEQVIALQEVSGDQLASLRAGLAGRTIHALLSPFEAHRRDGSVGFSYSNVAGVLGATALSRLWEPPSDHGPGNIGRAIAYSFGGSAAYNVLREFVPDLIRRIQKR